MAKCSVCGSDLVCTHPHDGPPPVLGAVEEPCPVDKGAIWIYARDDTGAGVPGIEVDVAGTAKNTDPDGFAPFDPLDPNAYTTKVNGLGDKAETLYVFSEETVPATVTRGQIKLVTYDLMRFSDLEVKVKRTDIEEDNLYEEAEVKLDVSPPLTAPSPEKTGPDGLVTFEKLKKGTYTVGVTLKTDDQPNYDVDLSPGAEYGVSPTGANVVEIPITPNGWIKFVFEKGEEDESEAITGAKLKLELKQGETERPADECEEDGTLEIKSLLPGDMEVTGSEAEGVWEFEELTSD
jgi:hypothetical protein